MNRKTERHYGAVIAAIRKVAAQGKPFSRLDVPKPQGTVSFLLYEMARAGELAIVQKGIPRRGGKPAIYSCAARV